MWFWFSQKYNFGSTSSTTWIEKTIRFILAVSAKHCGNNNTLYYNFYYIQISGRWTRTELSDSLHRILSEQRLEKTPRSENTRREGVKYFQPFYFLNQRRLFNLWIIRTIKTLKLKSISSQNGANSCASKNPCKRELLASWTPSLRNELGKIDHLKRNLPSWTSCGGGLLPQKLPTESGGAIRARERRGVCEPVKICILYSGIEDVFTWSIPTWKLIQVR